METRDQTESDEQEVLAANSAFYQALQSLDLEQMEPVWLHEDWVRCLHPGWDLIVGWEEVKESWATIFRSTARMQISIRRAMVQVLGDAAWVSCLENMTASYLDGFSSVVIEATNVFIRQQGRWRMVHRHTSPVPERFPSGATASVQ
jgi:ketosteroid isomerase-like protein